MCPTIPKHTHTLLDFHSVSRAVQLSSSVSIFYTSLINYPCGVSQWRETNVLMVPDGLWNDAVGAVWHAVNLSASISLIIHRHKGTTAITMISLSQRNTISQTNTEGGTQDVSTETGLFWPGPVSNHPEYPSNTLATKQLHPDKQPEHLEYQNQCQWKNIPPKHK